MDFNIRAGMRVLYKHNNQWEIGRIANGNARINEKGLYLFIIPKEFLDLEDNEVPFTHDAEINEIFFDAFPLEDWIKDYPKYFMTKEDYIKFIESDEFDKHLENACVSDGEYGYYPISKYTRAWIEKQPFDYVIRGE